MLVSYVTMSKHHASKSHHTAKTKFHYIAAIISPRLALKYVHKNTQLFPWNFGTQVKSIPSQSHVATDG
jgi:hypothetical protein